MMPKIDIRRHTVHDVYADRRASWRGVLICCEEKEEKENLRVKKIHSNIFVRCFTVWWEKIVE